MPTFLSDPSYLQYGVLALLMATPLLAALLLPTDRPAKGAIKSNRNRVLFAVSAFAAFLLLASYLCDHFLESDREQVIRKLTEMSDGVQQRDLDKVFQHVSSSFKKGPLDKKSLRDLAERARQSGQVTEIKIWDAALEPFDSAAQTAIAAFTFKVEGTIQTNIGYRCKARFVKDPDGQWRLQGFDVFNPVVDANTPMPIPGLQ